MFKIRTFLFVQILTFFFFVPMSNAEMHSNSYKISSMVIAGGGQSISSTSCKLVSTLGQPTASQGGISSSGYRLQLGLWYSLLFARDRDRDGIADSWEIIYFSDLDTANDVSDYDRDGYTDLQEYLNNLAQETDPAGGMYDPTARNAPGGNGYFPFVNGSDFWILMLPAILGENR